MDHKEILDTLKAAQTYLSRLKSLDNELESAVKQIINTYEETERNIHETFSNLKDVLVNILNKRQNRLLDQANKTKNEGLAPLEECRNVITSKIETTNSLITLGNSIINRSAIDGVVKFTTDASLLGSLPEVPELKEVPFISFHVDQSCENEVKEILSEFGEVSRIAPIQITELSAKPGAILVEWQNVENDDRLTDIQEFRLQRAFGDVIKEKHLLVNFKDCYQGLDTQFLVKDLKVEQSYSFRVCCKFEGIHEWSPWSLPQVARTSLKPFCWQTHDDYVLSNENKIAKPTVTRPRILYSDGAQFCVGHSVEFTFLETDSGDAIIGLLSEELPNASNLKCVSGNSFLMDKGGKIYVDGTEKSTRLSDFTKGLKVCFTCDLVSDHKIRVNIDCNEKRVTYEWPIDADSRLFFVSHFFSSNWKIMVE